MTADRSPRARALERPPDRRTLLGRAPELAELDDALSRAIAGQGALVLVEGEAGIGKSCLLSEIASRGRSRGAVAAWGRAWEEGGAPPFWPWTQVLRTLAAGTTDLPAEAATLISDEGRAAPESPDARFRLFDAVASFLAAGSERRPVLVLLDDLHAADEPTLLLLRFAARELGESRVLVVGAHRDAREARAGRVLGELARHGTRLPLRGLDASSVAQLLGDVLGGECPPEVSRAVHEATDGNPFFVEEVARLFRAEGVSGPRVPVPLSVRDAIAMRLGALSKPCRDALELGAVVGREHDTGLIARSARAVDEAVRAGILRVVDGTRFAFTHGLVRDAVYESLPSSRRGALHARTARALASARVEAAEIAHHWLRAGPEGRGPAAEWSVTAGRSARTQLAYEEAVVHFQNALEALPGDRAATRREILLDLGEARLRSRDTEGARRAFEEAAADGDGATLARAALEFSWGWQASGTVVDTTRVRLLEAALASPANTGPVVRSRLCATLAEVLLLDPASIARRDALSREAVDLARGAGDAPALARALHARRLAIWGPDTLEERVALGDEALATARGTGARELAVECLFMACSERLECGDVAGFDAAFAEVTRLVRELRQSLYAWVVDAGLALRELWAGRVAEAERLSASMLSKAAEAEAQIAQQFAGVHFAIGRILQGRVAEIVPVLEAMAAVYTENRAWRCALALAHAQLGSREQAAAELARALAGGVSSIPRDMNWLLAATLAAEVCASVEDLGLAAELYRALAPFDGRTVVVGGAAAYWGPVSQALGLLAHALGRHDAAVAHLQDAIAQIARFGAPPFGSRARQQLAEILEARGEPGDEASAARLRRSASETLSALGLDVRTRVPDAPPRAREAVLRRDGDGWRVGFAGSEFGVGRIKGLTYIARLVAEPERELHAVDLAGGQLRLASDAGAHLDATAREAYASRVRALREDLAEAESCGDAGRASAAKDELTAIERELARAFGLGGRGRRAASDTERARVSVRLAIATAIRRVAEHDAALGRHLESCVRTGTYCSYRPDPSAPVAWTL